MKPLRKITFDGYILLKMKDYQRKHGNNEGFRFVEVPNRNRIDVCDELWRKMLWRHLRTFNYN